MKIQEANTEEGYKIVYEPGDKIKITQSSTFHIKKGDTGKVISGPWLSGNASVYELNIDSLSNSWGYVDIPDGYFKPYSITRAKLPELIREWKQNQVRELIGA